MCILQSVLAFVWTAGRKVDVAHNAAAAVVVVGLHECDVVPLGGGQLRVVTGVGRGPVLALVQPNHLSRRLLYQGPTQKRLKLKFIRIKRVAFIIL